MSTVLVVEDESAIAELIAINLRHAGFEVTLAENAEQATAAVDAVLKVIAAQAVSEVTTEGLRTLAVLGKPPTHVTVTGCTFTTGQCGKV